MNKPYLFGVVGNPVEHSLSPRLHKAALEAAGLVGEYRLYPVQPIPRGRQALQALFNSTRSGEIDGLNVTIPHKQAVLPYLDSLTPAARKIGAVNTVLNNHGRLVGENTDMGGFMADLERVSGFECNKTASTTDASDRLALVLGAGGAARAVVFGLLNGGWKVVVAARRIEQGYEMRDWGLSRVIQMDAVSISSLQQKITLVVNATPMGMWSYTKDSPWPRGIDFPGGALVYDLVYNPGGTTLVREAREAGLQAVNGLGMLVEQAALAFERWTGIVASRQSMRQAVFEFSSFSSFEV